MPAPTKAQKQAQQILQTALALAEKSHWESVRMHHISDAADVSLNTIRVHFREKEDLVDAWFDQADQAMLKACGKSGFSDLSRCEKLHTTLMAWLDSLAPYQRVTRQMIQGKLEPGHLHFQINGLLRISRTVQWWREAAGIETRLPLRAFEEVAMTGLYLVTFSHWMLDQSEQQQSTCDFLRKRLEQAKHYNLQSPMRKPRPELIDEPT